MSKHYHQLSGLISNQGL